MAISKEPRHWFAIIAVLDFSGEPPPKWRSTSMVILWPIVLLAILFNVNKDKKG